MQGCTPLCMIRKLLKFDPLRRASSGKNLDPRALRLWRDRLPCSPQVRESFHPYLPE